MSPLWHDAVDRPRTFFTLQNATQQHCKHHSDSGQQVSSLYDIAQEGPAVYLMQRGDFPRGFRYWTGVTDNVTEDTVLHVRAVQFHASPFCISQWFSINVV